jgi:hypothetical protein
VARATVYTAHVRGRGRGDEDVVLVKDGFSWPAFFFTLVWALWHRLWLFALIVAASGVAIGLVSEMLTLDPLTDAAIGLAWSVLIGFEANDARRRALARRDYDVEDIVLGLNLAQAEHRFFQKHHHLYATPA